MSGLTELGRLQWAVADVCPLFVTGGIGPLMVGLDYYPLLASLGLYAIGLYCYELYLLALSTALTIDFLGNWALREAIRAAPRFDGCGPSHGMPAYAAQHAMFFEVALMTAYTCVWRASSRASSFKLALLRVFGAVALFAHVYIGASRSTELFVGGLIGLVEAVAFQCLMCLVVRRWAARVLRWRGVRWLGLRDRLCLWGGSDAPTPLRRCSLTPARGWRAVPTTPPFDLEPA